MAVAVLIAAAASCAKPATLPQSPTPVTGASTSKKLDCPAIVKKHATCAQPTDGVVPLKDEDCATLETCLGKIMNDDAFHAYAACEVNPACDDCMNSIAAKATTTGALTKIQQQCDTREKACGEGVFHCASMREPAFALFDESIYKPIGACLDEAHADCNNTSACIANALSKTADGLLACFGGGAGGAQEQQARPSGEEIDKKAHPAEGFELGKPLTEFHDLGKPNRGKDGDVYTLLKPIAFADVSDWRTTLRFGKKKKDAGNGDPATLQQIRLESKSPRCQGVGNYIGKALGPPLSLEYVGQVPLNGKKGDPHAATTATTQVVEWWGATILVGFKGSEKSCAVTFRFITPADREHAAHAL